MPTALVVHAHPDDEVFATGAATSGLSEQGWDVVLRVATAGLHGASGHLTASCDLLGISKWGWLGAVDQWIDDGGHAGPGTLAAAHSEAVAEPIAQAIDELRPELVLTVGRDGLTGHPDHIAVSRAVETATRHTGCRVLGSRLRAQDVRAGTQLVQQLAPDQQIGSGRVTGCTTPLERISGASEQRRRQALDEYYEGLGSKPLDELLKVHRPTSDGLLLRAVFDATTWTQDLFEDLTT
jgi:LmbE family N-acetylglucosaminyl deacetylase